MQLQEQEKADQCDAYSLFVYAIRSQVTKDYCRVCKDGKSHEALEFFNSILDEATAKFMDSKEFQEFMKESGYAKL